MCKRECERKGKEERGGGGGGGGGGVREGWREGGRNGVLVLLTAPLQSSLMEPSGNLTTTDIRFLVLKVQKGRVINITQANTTE